MVALVSAGLVDTVEVVWAAGKVFGGGFNTPGTDIDATVPEKSGKFICLVWLDDLRFYVLLNALFNNISGTSGR